MPKSRQEKLYVPPTRESPARLSIVHIHTAYLVHQVCLKNHEDVIIIMCMPGALPIYVDWKLQALLQLHVAM